MARLVSKEIPRNHWQEFCRRYSQEHRGSLMRVEVPLAANQGAQIVARQIALQDIVPRVNADDSVDVLVVLGEKPREQEHCIEKLLRMDLETDGNTLQEDLSFSVVSGRKTLLVLEPGERT